MSAYLTQPLKPSQSLPSICLLFMAEDWQEALNSPRQFASTFQHMRPANRAAKGFRGLFSIWRTIQVSFRLNNELIPYLCRVVSSSFIFFLICTGTFGHQLSPFTGAGSEQQSLNDMPGSHVNGMTELGACLCFFSPHH